MSILPIFLSLCSFVLAALSLFVTYRQKEKTDTLANRKALTDVIAAISATNIEMAKLSDQSTQTVSLRRNLNSQRRYLVNHADLLAEILDGMTTDIDHQIIAGAFESATDFDRAEQHWKMCIDKSSAASVKSVNLRGFAMYNFRLGRFEVGRKCYEQALQGFDGDGDQARRYRADTYILWALNERDYGFTDEANRRMAQAYTEAKRVGSQTNRAQILEYLASAWEASENAAISCLDPTKN